MISQVEHPEYNQTILTQVHQPDQEQVQQPDHNQFQESLQELEPLLTHLYQGPVQEPMPLDL